MNTKTARNAVVIMAVAAMAVHAAAGSRLAPRPQAGSLLAWG